MNEVQPRGAISFRDLVRGSTNATPEYQYWADDTDLSDDDETPLDIDDDPKCPVILLTKAEKKRLRDPWKNAIIIKMFNAKIGYMSLMKRLKKKWELKGGLILTDIGHEYFIG